jgi:hypothetical protein
MVNFTPQVKLTKDKFIILGILLIIGLYIYFFILDKSFPDVDQISTFLDNSLFAIAMQNMPAILL